MTQPLQDKRIEVYHQNSAYLSSHVVALKGSRQVDTLTAAEDADSWAAEKLPGNQSEGTECTPNLGNDDVPAVVGIGSLMMDGKGRRS